MGYTTEFAGSFKFDKPLSFEHVDELDEIHEGPGKLEIDGVQRPNGYNQWELLEDRTTLEWDGGEKFYDYVEHLQFIAALTKSWGYVLNGEVTWQGEEQSDHGKIVVRDNVVKVMEGRLVFEDEDRDKAIQEAVKRERERCLAWVQHARFTCETDMRQVRAWIEYGEWPTAQRK